jgi:arsenate reductase (thioredoxin)
VKARTMRHKPKVLFFSTGNATRSRMAAAFLGRMVGDDVGVVSTAVRSTEANPLAIEVMNEVGIDISREPVKPVADSLKESFACVVTLSDDCRERRPVWPFSRNVVHWSLSDPAAVDGPPERQREVFRRIRDEIRERVRHFMAEVAPRLQGRATPSAPLAAAAGAGSTRR